MSAKDSRRLIKAARKAGWTVEPTRSGHLRWRSPSGDIVISAGTPSDHRSWANTRARLRRLGCPGA